MKTRKVRNINPIKYSLTVLFFLIVPFIFGNLAKANDCGVQEMADLVPASADPYICWNCGYGSYLNHYGVDYSVGVSVPVYARGNGEVVYAGNTPFSQWAGPNHVIIKYTMADGRYYYQSAYHMSSKTVSVGQCVSANDVIGMSGAMGNAPGGIHLHDELIICDLNYLFFYGWGPSCYIDPTSVGKGRTIELPPITAKPTSVPVTPGETIIPYTPIPITPKPIISITPKPGVTNLPEAGNNEGTVQTNTTAKAYYLDTPANWDMDSCEKVVTNADKDVIEGTIDIPRCVNGHSAKNTTIGCSNKWVLAYAETVSVDSFPLLNFLAASNTTTKYGDTELQNKVIPACYYNITQNLTKDVPEVDSNGNIVSGKYVEQEMSFSKDYFGMLKLTASSGRKDVYSNYPKLGTAISCLTLNWADIKYSPILDIQTFNKSLPDIPSDENLGNIAGASDVGGWFDSIFGKDGFLASIINKIKEAVTYNDDTKLGEKYLKNVTNFSLPDGKDSVCSCSSTDKITRVNESDFGEPQKGAKRSVVNQNEEILDLTNTQICDHQYIDGDVIDILSCQMTGTIGNGYSVVKGSRGSTMEGEGYLKRNTNCRYDGSELRCDCTKLVYCGREFDCGESIGSLYSQCKSSGLTVVEQVGAVVGSPKYIFSKPGFEKLTIPGMNKALYNAQAALDQINSSYDIKYGENIGIRIPTTREVFDLNSKVLSYGPDKSKGDDYDPSTIKSSLKYFIGYKKTDLNYKFLNDWASQFKKVGDTILVDYYFPYIGKLPYIYERLSAIHSNQSEKKTGTTLQNISVPDKNSYFYSAQIELCSSLSEEEKLKQDCYTKDICGDLMTDYLERNDLVYYNCAKSTSANIDNPVKPTVTPGEIPNGPFECKSYTNADEVNGFIATLAAKYPQYIKSGLSIKFEGNAGYCLATNNPIICPESFLINGYMTNRLILHEVMHQSRSGVVGGGDLNATSELQASIMENIVISGNCEGGTYQFKGKDGITRKPGDIAASLLAAGVSEADLWKFALGRSDTISQFINKVVTGASKFSDVYCKEYGFGVPYSGNDNPIACSGSTILGLSTVNSAYCPSSGSGSNPSSLLCLIKMAVESLNAGNPKMTPELIYAIGMQETGLTCYKTWTDWAAKKNNIECTGDANQMAFGSRNGFTSYDVRGITQFNSITWNPLIAAHESEMAKCTAAIGVNYNPSDPELIDPVSSNKKYSRHRVGDMICASIIKLAEDAKAATGSYVTPEKWLSGSGPVWYVASRYHGSCDGQWAVYCGNVQTYMNAAKGLFSSLSCK